MIFGPRLRRGLDQATASLRFAALKRSNKQEEAEEEEEEEWKREDWEEKGCTEGAKRPPIIVCIFTKVIENVQE